MYTKVIINVVNVNVIVRLRLKVLDPGLGSGSEFSSYILTDFHKYFIFSTKNITLSYF